MSAQLKVIHMDERRTGSSEGPRLEDGYVRIANELFDAILGFRFTLKQQSVVLAVVRKTYGYGKKADDMSASQIGGACGMSRNHVTETLNELAAMNVITKSAGKYGSVIGINKHYKTWKKTEKQPKNRVSSPESGLVPNRDVPSPESGLVPNRDVPSPESGLEVVPNQDGSIVPNRDTQKTTFQKTTSKDNLNIAQSADCATSPADTSAAFGDFWDAFGYKKGKAKAEEAFAREYAKASFSTDWLQTVVTAAAKEAQRRPHLVAAGKTPMYAQGWLSQRRYNDEDLATWGAFSPEQQAFVDCFNSHIGDTAPQCTEWTERRAALIDIAMRGKWDAERWSQFWQWVAEHCEFRWPVSIDWLLQRDNFVAVKEGKYQRDGGTGE